MLSVCRMDLTIEQRRTGALLLAMGSWRENMIVTRDKSHFRGSPIKVQSPDEFLASLGTVTYLLKWSR